LPSTMLLPLRFAEANASVWLGAPQSLARRQSRRSGRHGQKKRSKTGRA
jgi:hypothetical protein